MNEFLPLGRVVCGNCLDVMREWPAESIDMVMFSPPYWGLRDYGEETVTIWDGNPNCEHDWGEEKTRWPNASGGMGYKQDTVRGAHYVDYHDRTVSSDFCVKCGAWKGQLGLEPSWQMYVLHMVEICREIKRVLKKTGSMYIVLGDTYAGSCSGHGDTRLVQNFRRMQDGYMYNKPYPQRKAQGYKPKCLMGIPWRVAFALIEDGWILRNDIIWHKPNAMPSSVKDRLTQTYEHIFHFVKARRYYYDLDAIREPHAQIDRRTKKGLRRVIYNGKLSTLGESHSSWLGQHPKGKNPGDVTLTKHDLAVNRFGNFSYTDPLHVKAYNIKGKNHGDFWSICTKPFKGAHFAVYPEEICVRPIKSSCPLDGIVLDPMCGSGTTLVVAKKLGRRFVGIEINPQYCEIARKRLSAIPEKLTKFLIEDMESE